MKKVSIIGMGALGLLFGSLIYKNIGPDSVEFVMDDERFEKYSSRDIKVNGEVIGFKLTRASEASPADLLLVCTKTTGLEDAIREMKNVIGKDTVIVSVLNGITSEQQIGDVYGYENIVYCVAQAMDAMKFGDEMTFLKKGELRLGVTETGRKEALDSLVEFLERAEIAYTLEDDIIRRQWSKFMLNVGLNQTCMVFSTNYGGSIIKGTEANRSMIAAMREVIAIAHAEGIDLSEADINQYVDIIDSLTPEGLPSMAQDRINRRYSEVETFAGTVIKLAEKHNIYVPENEYLYKRVKEIEAEY